MSDLSVTIVGNLTDEPELRFTPQGTAVCRFQIAHNPRKPDGQGGWTDGEPTFLPCTAWRQLAENIAESLPKGSRVIAHGNLRTERWEKDGQKHSRIVFDVRAIGPELSYATAKVQKMARTNDVAPDDPWTTASKTRPEKPATA